MEPRQLKVISYVNFPHVSVSDIMVDITHLVHSYPNMIESFAQKEINRFSAMILCKIVLNAFTREIQKSIETIVSSWKEKALSIYSHVPPSQCFFGIEDRYVLENMKNTLPQFFSRVFTNTDQCVDCGSIYEFSRLAAQCVVGRINQRVTTELPNTMYVRPMTDERLSDYYFYFDEMIRLVGSSIECVRMGVCQCGVQPEDDETSYHILDERDGAGMLLHMDEDNCITLYSTTKKRVMCMLMKEIPSSSEENQDDGNSADGNGDDEVGPDHPDVVPGLCDQRNSISSINNWDEDDPVFSLFSWLLKGLVFYTIKKAKLPFFPNGFNIISNLKKKAKKQIKLCTLRSFQLGDLDKLYKDVFKDLQKNIGNAREVLAAIKTERIDNIIIEVLRIRMTTP